MAFTNVWLAMLTLLLQVWFSLHHLLPGYWNYFHDSNEVRGGELLRRTWDLLSGTSALKAF